VRMKVASTGTKVVTFLRNSAAMGTRYSGLKDANF
jgi:hypothetical protein